MEVLHDFKSHTLDEQAQVAHKSRVETKFLVHVAALNTILSELSDSYSMLKVNGQQIQAYHSHYFDTRNYRFYHTHHNGQLPRLKIRIRDYLASGQRYLEIKQKKSQLFGTKERLLVPQNYLPSFAETFVHQHCQLSLKSLVPSLLSSYKRLSLMSLDKKERVTFDTELNFSNLRNKESQQLKKVVLIEIKQNNKNHCSPAFQVFRRLNQHPLAFSKYCVGTALTSSITLKKNRFKCVIRKVTDTESKSNLNNSKHSNPVYPALSSDLLVNTLGNVS